VDRTLHLKIRNLDRVEWIVSYAERRHSGTAKIDGDLGKLYASTIAIVQEHGIAQLVLDAPFLGLEQCRAVILLVVLKRKITCRLLNVRGPLEVGA
jgi:hypothetical protein